MLQNSQFVGAPFRLSGQWRDGSSLDCAFVLGRVKGKLKAIPNHSSNYSVFLYNLLAEEFVELAFNPNIFNLRESLSDNVSMCMYNYNVNGERISRVYHLRIYSSRILPGCAL